MRIFKTLYFHRWAKTELLTDRQLYKAVQDIKNGLHDGNLGGNIYKKRIAS